MKFFYFIRNIFDHVGQTLQTHAELLNNFAGIFKNSHQIIEHPAQKDCEGNNTKRNHQK
jgi:hypothetical protein